MKNGEVIASNIAHQLHLYSESGLPHSNLIGAIARTLKLKIDYKNYYSDEYIKIVGDESKDNKHWQIYYTPTGADTYIL